MGRNKIETFDALRANAGASRPTFARMRAQHISLSLERKGALRAQHTSLSLGRKGALRAQHTSLLLGKESAHRAQHTCWSSKFSPNPDHLKSQNPPSALRSKSH